MAERELTLAAVARRADFERVAASLEPSVGIALEPGPQRSASGRDV